MNLSKHFMQRALQLAQLGRGVVSPNPMVGCVIVHQNQIIGEGWHQKYGEAHAEVNAIGNAESNGFASLLPNATVYVTLEPCSHFGKTPPCADLLIEKKVKKVIVCNHDPNPLVAGKGIQKLQKAGIEVEIGILETDGLELNKRFFTFIEKKRPYIIIKWAETADGFIAQENNKPLIISNKISHALSHRWRTEEDAIMVGTNTAISDNPRLDARLWRGKNPTRIVIDRHSKLPKDLHLLDGLQPTIVYRAFNDLEDILADLYHRKLQSLIVEGGSQLIQSFINQGLWDEIRIFEADKLIGTGIKSPVLDKARPSQTIKLQNDVLKIYTYQDQI